MTIQREPKKEKPIPETSKKPKTPFQLAQAEKRRMFRENALANFIERENQKHAMQRLMDITRIESEVEIYKIGYKLREFIDYELEAHQIDVRQHGTEEKRWQTLEFYELTDEQASQLEGILSELKIQDFPENSPHKNTVDLFIEGKWDLEIFRLLNLIEFAETKEEREKERERRKEENRRRQEELRKEMQEREEYIRRATSEHMEMWKRRKEKEEQLRTEEEELRVAEGLAKQRFEAEKLPHRERVKAEQAILKQKVDEYLSQIKLRKIEEQTFTDEEEEERLREISPLDEMYQFGKLSSNKKDERTRKGRYKTGEFVYDEDVAEELIENFQESENEFRFGEMRKADVQDFANFSDWEDHWISERVAQVDSPEELKIWNNYLPSLKIFNPRKFLWQKEGKYKKALRTCFPIQIPELGIDLEGGAIVSKQIQEALFIQAQEYNSEDAQTRKLAQKSLELVLHMHIGLVVYMIKDLKHFSPTRYMNVSGDDLFSLGIFGIIASLKNYEPRNDENGYVGVTPYIKAYIEGYMRSLNEQNYDFNDRQINIPVHFETIRNKLERVRRLVAISYPDKKVDPERVREIFVEQSQKNRQKWKLNVRLASLIDHNFEKFLRIILDTYAEVPHAMLGEEIKATMHDVDMLGNFLLHEPEQIKKADMAALRSLVTSTLATFSPRQERILRMRFGIGTEEKTLEDVAIVFGVTRERIRQMEAKVLRLLNHPSRSRKLREFLD